jgi:DNA mismatch endonuclease (patch repair protein)
MARVRGRDTAPELLLRRSLWQRGLRYRLQRRVNGCRPDLIFPRKKVAVFVDGCFWHGCPRHYTRPKTSRAFWQEKLRANVERDRRQTLALESIGWRVVRLWEHEVNECVSLAADLVQEALDKPEWTPRKDWRVSHATDPERTEAPPGLVELVSLRNPMCTRRVPCRSAP